MPALRGRAIFFLAKLVPGILGLGTTAMLTRWVEPAQYGVYAFGLSIILFTVGAGYLDVWAALNNTDAASGTANPCLLRVSTSRGSSDSAH